MWRRQALPHGSVPCVILVFSGSFETKSRRTHGLCFPSKHHSTFFFLLLLCLPDQSSRIFLVHDVCQSMCVWGLSACNTWPRAASMSSAKPQTPLASRVRMFSHFSAWETEVTDLRSGSRHSCCIYDSSRVYISAMLRRLSCLSSVPTGISPIYYFKSRHDDLLSISQITK